MNDIFECSDGSKIKATEKLYQLCILNKQGVHIKGLKKVLKILDEIYY